MVKPATYSPARIEPILAEQGPAQRRSFRFMRNYTVPFAGLHLFRVTYREGRVERL